ncbi:hypothetical protein [Streptomyces sp. NPDC054940]
MSYYDHVVWEADPQDGGGRGRGEDHEGGQEQGRLIAVPEQRATTSGPRIWPTEYPAVSRATERGNPRWAPVARASA